MVKTYGEIYRQICRLLEFEEDINPAFVARELMAHVTEKTPAQIIAMDRIYASEENAEQIMALANRVLSGEPLAYVIGKWDFGGRTYCVTPDVLIPRDDTMALVELALAAPLPQPCRILDLCTGSGCIGITLAMQLPEARVTLADLSVQALKVAKKNVAEHHLSARVACMSADALSPAPRILGQYDLIVSNPPYVTADEMKTLEPSVRDHEPHMALDGGDDGLDFYRAIPVCYANALRPGGVLCFEFGMGQADSVCAILEEYDYEVLRLKKDLRGITRAVMAKKKERESENGNGEG